MEISSSQMFRKFNKWCLSALTLLFLAGAYNSQAQGGDLFKAKCATCHQVFKDGTGPKLYQVRERWEAAGAGDDVIIQWVHDYEKAAAMNSHAKSRLSFSGTNMNKFPELTDEQIISIFDWVDEQEEVVAGSTDGGAAEGGAEEESSLGWVWFILGGMFVIIILSVGGVRRQLKNAEAEASGSDFDTTISYSEELKQWAWLNRKYVGLIGLVVVIGVVVTLFLGLYTIGVVENYQPSQPIAFPHSVHAGDNGIDCKYCHNSVEESKTAGLPSVNVCMNCHKQITGSGDQVAQIQKIYDAAGWDGKKYTNVTKPIVWNKVHVLPDHVYFNHKQHVVVGGVDCKQCHGNVPTFGLGRVSTTEEINKLAGTDGIIALTKPLLTMGWCLECHNEKAVDLTKSEYYQELHNRLGSRPDFLRRISEDDKITVRELGGWECAKCHY